MNHPLSGINDPLFRTLVEVEPCIAKVMPHSKLMFIGSCFTQNIGDRSANSGLKCAVNPFGIVYNPISICNQLERLIENRPYVNEEVRFKNGLYHTFDHHSCFSGSEKEAFLSGINNSLTANAGFLKQSNFLFITLGTAFAYWHSESDQLVANCHKYPAKEFQQRLLSVEAVVERYTALLSRLFLVQPTLKVVFSVSPIRHQRDGFHNNNLSKAVLLLSIQKLQEKFSQIDYFPAYEIVLDELRDYRFFADDMMHVNQTAINYVWQKFGRVFFDKTTVHMIGEYENLLTDFNHKPFNFHSLEHQKFLKSVERKLILFKDRYPDVQTSGLKNEIERRLKMD